MTVTPLAVNGAFRLQPDVYEDERGSFHEAFRQSKWFATNPPSPEHGMSPVQMSMSHSRRGVLRGLHGDPNIAKLVSCAQGFIWDVVVDVREGSPTFGKHAWAVLTGHNHAQLFVPRGCLHGFLALEYSVVTYLQDHEYDATTEIRGRWDDFGIPWPLESLGLKGDRPILSAKDAAPLRTLHPDDYREVGRVPTGGPAHRTESALMPYGDGMLRGPQ